MTEDYAKTLNLPLKDGRPLADSETGLILVFADASDAGEKILDMGETEAGVVPVPVEALVERLQDRGCGRVILDLGQSGRFVTEPENLHRVAELLYGETAG